MTRDAGLRDAGHGFPLETVAFLDVEVNHIIKYVGHIIRCFKKRFKGSDFFLTSSNSNTIFHIFAPNLKFMKKLFLSLCVCLLTTSAIAGNILYESFEYANHDLEKPVGWTCDDNSWLCGYLEKDHNRIAHSGNWYAFTATNDAWMFMPTYFIEEMQYRFTLWAITDGDYQLEIWAGSSPNVDDMHTQFLSTTIDKDEYDKVSVYVENIPANCQYFAIHAVGNGGTYLTIDDIEVDMVEQYTFEAEAITGDTAMYPGTEGIFHFLVENTGYDPVDITMHPSNEFFTNFICQHNGDTGMTIHTEPAEIVEVTMTGTLRPEIEPGTVAWLDIQMTIPCNCNTAMVTFWVTPLDITQVAENGLNVSVYPNPATDFVTIEADDLQQVILMDMTGKTLSSIAAEGRSVRLDVGNLKAGVYLISAKTRSTSSFVKSILKM